MSLRDATKKMSKSDESDMSRINLTDSKEAISNKIRKAKTDSIQGVVLYLIRSLMMKQADLRSRTLSEFLQRSLTDQ